MPVMLVFAAGVVVTALSLVVAVLLELAPGPPPRSAGDDVAGQLFCGWAFMGVGVLIAYKRPGHGVGWALILAGSAFLLETVFVSYADLALYTELEAGYPAGGIAAALGSPMWTGIMAGVFMLLVYFPTGRAPSRLWSVVARVSLLCYGVVALGIILGPTLEDSFDGLENPLTVDTGGVMELLSMLAVAFSMLTFMAAAASILIRFRRSHGEERQQHKWLALAAVALLAALPYGYSGGFVGLPGLLMVVALLATPVAVGIAVFRYRLYEIDRLLNRGLVYALLTATLVLTYAGVVLALQAILSPINGSSDLAIAVTTIVVAAMFQPVRRRMQSAVDRRFNRHDYDAARALERFAGRMRSEIDLATLEQELVGVLEETVQPQSMRLWLRPNSEPAKLS